MLLERWCRWKLLRWVSVMTEVVVVWGHDAVLHAVSPRHPPLPGPRPARMPEPTSPPRRCPGGAAARGWCVRGGLPRARTPPPQRPKERSFRTGRNGEVIPTPGENTMGIVHNGFFSSSSAKCEAVPPIPWLPPHTAAKFETTPHHTTLHDTAPHHIRTMDHDTIVTPHFRVWCGGAVRCGAVLCSLVFGGRPVPRQEREAAVHRDICLVREERARCDRDSSEGAYIVISE
jgi:hypothetical protein